MPLFSMMDEFGVHVLRCRIALTYSLLSVRTGIDTDVQQDLRVFSAYQDETEDCVASLMPHELRSVAR